MLISMHTSTFTGRRKKKIYIFWYGKMMARTNLNQTSTEYIILYSSHLALGEITGSDRTRKSHELTLLQNYHHNAYKYAILIQIAEVSCVQHMTAVVI